jgi:hypothetical protein
LIRHDNPFLIPVDWKIIVFFFTVFHSYSLRPVSLPGVHPGSSFLSFLPRGQRESKREKKENVFLARRILPTGSASRRGLACKGVGAFDSKCASTTHGQKQQTLTWDPQYRTKGRGCNSADDDECGEIFAHSYKTKKTQQTLRWGPAFTRQESRERGDPKGGRGYRA